MARQAPKYVNNLIEVRLSQLQAIDMSEDRNQGKRDYTEVEFELGDLEFEAKGKSVVVERMFKLLLQKIESGGIAIGLAMGQDEEEEEEEEEKEEEGAPEEAGDTGDLAVGGPETSKESLEGGTVLESPDLGLGSVGTPPTDTDTGPDRPPSWDAR